MARIQSHMKSVYTHKLYFLKYVLISCFKLRHCLQKDIFPTEM